MPQVQHTLAPVYDSKSRVLILGTMPSPASRAAGMYYGHPKNRFWPTLGHVLGCEIPEGLEGRQAILRAHGIALWDVLASCDIQGAGDSTIRNPVPNDLAPIFAVAGIQAVFTTGKQAQALYTRLCPQAAVFPAHYLPSPSPANCAVGDEAMKAAYAGILAYLSIPTT